MTVQVLRLSGLEPDEALNEAERLLDIRAGGPRQLGRLLVVDEVSRLAEHGQVYHRLETSRRIYDMLCVAAGGLPTADGALTLPENLGGSQGTGVIWVGDEFGIDWRLAAPSADGHDGRVSGLARLVELLTDDNVFGRIHEAFMTRIPGKVANPGLWLAGADAEEATFAAALVMAISRMSQSGPGRADPFAELLPDVAGGATLAPAGRVARDGNEVAEWVAAAAREIDKSAGLGKLFGRGGGARDHVIEAGAVLGGLRDHIAQLLRHANAADRPTDQQYQLIREAGIQFPLAAAGRGAGNATGSPVYRSVAEALRSGDTLSLLVERLQATERGLERTGSARYLPEVERRCPQQLLSWLADPPQRLSRAPAGDEAAGDLSLDHARRAANALRELVLTVANREWSPATPSAAEVARVRIAVSSAAKALASDAHAAGAAALTSPGTQRARVASRAESLRPVLCDLVLQVVAEACDAHGATGTQARAAAATLTARLLMQWKGHVHDHGLSEPPPFAVAGGAEAAMVEASQVDAEIREAVLYGQDREMWQLCLPDDLGALDLSAQPYVCRFAPRLNRDALSGTVPPDTVWTSSAGYAGLLRLVPLQDRVVSARWHGVGLRDQPEGW